MSHQAGSVKGRRAASLVTLFGLLGGLNWGYDTGVIAGALLFLENDFTVTPVQIGWIVSGLVFGAAVAAGIGGKMADKYGRKRVLLFTALFFVATPLGMALAPTVNALIAWRVVSGIGTGMAAVVLPVYLSEHAPARRRGMIIALYGMSIILGQFIGDVVAALLANSENWRLMLGLSIIPSTLFVIGLRFVSETPRWLVKRGRVDEARAILLADRTPREAESELEEIFEAERSEHREGLKMLFQAAWVRPILVVGFGLAILQQIMGINTVMYFAPTIFTSVGFTDTQALWANVGIGTFNIGAVLLAVKFADKWGRRKILLFGAAGTALSLVTLGITYHALPVPDGIGPVAITTFIFLAAYIGVFQFSWGTIVWVLLGEIFPLRVRAVAMGVATVMLWIANAVVSFSFPVLLDAFGVGTLFIGFAVICTGSFIFVARLVPETKGKSLETIEAQFRGVPAAPELVGAGAAR